MTEERFKQLFPHASEDTVRANAAILGVEVALELPKARKRRQNVPNEPSSTHRGQISHSKPQPDEAPALGASVQGEAEGVRRTTVRFTGFRVHPLDPDNFAGSVKDLLDGLRHASIIHGDEPWRIRLETEQVKVAHFAEERTEIEVVA